tara:strand:+ start:598 stop:876 length:279 start_codon:yes stop_codon:yes gene_type:complete
MKRLIDGVLEDLTADEITAREAQEVTASTALELALSEVREKRNILIAETDYLALSDHTLSSDMTTYRQSLRDITNGLDTVEKCNNVTWPTKP